MQSRYPSLVKLEPNTNQNLVRFPTKPSDFDVQAFVWCELRSRGYTVRGEVSSSFVTEVNGKKRGARFDLVVYKEETAILIIEIKGVKTVENPFTNTIQGTKYPTYGVPVWIVYGQAGAEAMLASIDADGMPSSKFEGVERSEPVTYTTPKRLTKKEKQKEGLIIRQERNKERKLRQEANKSYTSRPDEFHEKFVKPFLAAKAQETA